MSTHYFELYDLFLSKISDYGFSSLVDEELEPILKNYLLSSIPEFIYCVQDLEDRNDIENKFNITLSSQEKNILVKIMIKNWLEPKVLNQELLKNIFGTRDFNLFSNAALLKEIQSLKSNIENEINILMTVYYHMQVQGS